MFLFLALKIVKKACCKYWHCLLCCFWCIWWREPSFCCYCFFIHAVYQSSLKHMFKTQWITLLCSITWHCLLQYIHALFKLLAEVQHRVTLAKCEFAMATMTFLGHVVEQSFIGNWRKVNVQQKVYPPFLRQHFYRNFCKHIQACVSINWAPEGRVNLYIKKLCLVFFKLTSCSVLYFSGRFHHFLKCIHTGCLPTYPSRWTHSLLQKQVFSVQQVLKTFGFKSKSWIWDIYLLVLYLFPDVLNRHSKSQVGSCRDDSI